MNTNDPDSTPHFTRHRLFWPLIALIGLLFFVTMGMAIHTASAYAAHAAETTEETLVADCVPVYLQHMDRAGGTAVTVLPGFPASMAALLAAVDAPEADAQSECAVR